MPGGLEFNPYRTDSSVGLTTAGGWENDEANPVSECIYGKSTGRLVRAFAVRTVLVSDQVGILSIGLRRDAVCRLGVELSGGSRYSTQCPSRPRRSSLSLSAFFAVFGFSLFLIQGAPARAEDLNVYLKTSPALGLLRPFADPVNISLLVTYADGRPVEQGRVAVVLEAPKPGAFMSTDFPAVENSRLLELTLALRRGRAEWKYLFPIRGDYRLSVNVVAADGQAMSKNFVIPVLENRAKWFWLGSFCTGLFLLGFAAGRIFTVIPTTGPAAAVLLLLGGFSIANGHDGPSSDSKAVSPPEGLEIAAATVGKPTRLLWHAPDGGNGTALLSLTITHLEKGKTVFAIDKVPVAKEYRLDFHFPDGTEYRVNSLAEVPGQRPLRTEQLVSVNGVEPPISAQVPALLFFVLVIALGLGAGRLSKILKNNRIVAK